jgi:hypothetical protein
LPALDPVLRENGPFLPLLLGALVADRFGGLAVFASVAILISLYGVGCAQPWRPVRARRADLVTLGA